MNIASLPTLANISVPKHVKVETTNSFESLMAEVGRKSMLGYSGHSFFGTAFIQGSRLQFCTAMPLERMKEHSKIDRSAKKDSVTEVMKRSNRPRELAHGKKLNGYLTTTACRGDKFILPSFTFNYGVGLTDDDPKALLIVFAGSGPMGEDGTNAWPAIFLLPAGAKLDTTDGAHRRHEVELLLASTKITDEQKDALRANAVSVNIVFEDSRIASHQDFADCGKAKSIPKGLVTTFDVRDLVNLRARDLVREVPFMAHYVDATAANVNLSARSKMVWSMNAVRTFVWHLNEHHPDSSLTTIGQRTSGAKEFFEAVVKAIPQLQALDISRKQADPETTAGLLRDRRGGDMLMRGVGLNIFARAYLHCAEHGISHKAMAEKLATVDWHVLNFDRGDLPANTPDDQYAFQTAVHQHANPIWSGLLMIRDDGYRISSSYEDADGAWLKICAQIFPALAIAAE